MRRTRGWVGTFAKFEAGPVTLVGPVKVVLADWSKPQPGPGPMVEPGALDRLTRSHPLLPFAVYAPGGIWLLWQSLLDGFHPAAVAIAYGLGLLGWSLFEYLAHRVSFHREPATAGAVVYGYLVHGVHHAYPDDPRRWVMPIWVTLPIAGALYFAFTLALGRIGPPAFAGFVHGYLAYDLLHYFIHRGRLPTRAGRFLRQYHLAHHHAMPDRHFGVSSPLWDVVFRTR